MPAPLWPFWPGVAPPSHRKDTTTDAGTLDKATARSHSRSRPTRLRGPHLTPRVRSSATRTCTPRCLSTRARPVARLGPKEAYRFAKGEQVTASSGQPAKLSRPLDFLVVADHSDNMGFFTDFLAGKPELLADPTGRRWYDMIQSGKPDQAQQAALEIVFGFSQGKFPKALIYAPGTARLSIDLARDRQGGG